MFTFLLTAHHAGPSCDDRTQIMIRRLANSILRYAPALNRSAIDDAQAFLNLANTFPLWPHDLLQIRQLTLTDPAILTAIRRHFENHKGVIFPDVKYPDEPNLPRLH